MQAITWLRPLAYITLLFLPALANAQWTTVGTVGFSTGAANYVSMATDANGTPYIVYADNGNGDKATVKKYNGTNWVTLGTAGFSAGAAYYTDMAIDGSGTPYVVYADVNSGQKATVMKYNGSSWVAVGTAGFTPDVAGYTNIAIDAGNTPYIVYRDYNSSGKATVQKYNGSSWVTVGTAGFSAALALFTDIAIDGSGTLYVGYSDGNSSQKATVMKYNGSSWVTVGAAAFSAGTTQYNSIAIDGSGTPYVTYQDNFAGITVKKYNGSSWVSVGSAPFSAGVASYTGIAINSSGTPYVCYKDANNSNKATVMKYNGSSWVIVGTTVSTAGSDFTCLAISRNDVMYAGFRDANVSGKATVKVYGNLWTGASTTVWGTGGNWSGGSAPASTDDAIIPYGCTNYPNITSVLTPVCNNLTMESGGSITVGTGGQLSIYGIITKSSGGTFTATSGKIKMAGSSAQTIPASTFSSNTIQDLEIANSSGVTLGGALGLTGTLTPTSGTFTTGGYFTLKSISSATGRIAAGTGSYISGTVTIERYIPGGRRVFRFLGNPTTAALPLSNLQDDIYVTGTGGTTNGFDSTQTQNPSAFWFDNTATVPGTWTAITNTSSDNSWTSQRGLRILVRGDRSQPTTLTGVNPTPNAVTLDITGTMKTGNQNVSLTNANSYHLLANPYASPTDIGTVIGAASNIGTQYWVWDAQSGTRGAYVTKLKAGGAYSIPSMSAFMVLPTGSSTLSFTESNKTSTESGTNSFFRTNNSIPGVGELKLLFDGYASDNIFLRRDDANALAGLDGQDGKKLWNQDMNIYFQSSTGESLSLDSRPFADSLVVPLGFSTNVTAASYALQLDSWGIDGYDMYLRDKLLNTEQKLSAGDVYNFTTTVANPGISRFDIVLRPSAILPLSALQLTAQQKGNNIQLNWNITGEETAVRYEVEYSRDGRSFETLITQNANGTKTYSWLHTSVSGTTHYYRIKNIAVNGSATYSAVVKVNTAKTNASISIYPNPVKQGETINISLNNLENGDYSLQFVDAAGKIIQQKTVKHMGGSTTITLSPVTLAAGNYIICIESQEKKFIEQLIVR